MTSPDAIPPATPLSQVHTPSADELGARLQARLDQIERNPDLAAHRHVSDRVTTDPARVEPSHNDPIAGVADLNAQLDLLRHQLEGAFDDIEQRIAAADHRAQAAATAAEAADQRAQVASARAANVLAAVDALTAELDRLVDELPPESIQRLRAAVGRLRGRVQSA